MNIKTQVKERLHKAKDEFITGNLIPMKLQDKILYGTTFTLGSLVMATESCFASTFFDGINDLISTYTTELVAVVLGLAGLLAVLALGAWQLWPSDRGSELGKRWFIRILVCTGILCCLGAIFAGIKEITAGKGLDISAL